MRIIITGTPGTGKSTIAAMLAEEMGLELVGIANVVRKTMRLGPTHEVDLKRLGKVLAFLSKKKDYVVEGHLACELRLPADFIFVLRTEPKMLKKRMRARGYGKNKIEENLMAEMLDYCTQRVAAEYKIQPLELDTTRRRPEASVKEMLQAIKQKKKKIDDVDYSDSLIAFLRHKHGR
jgi:adenylate kinase